uniref:Outer membrane lipoprotein-sorting protein n=1 Tax=candidate division WOR-3 bacterium TaxID=2052148 RepID=A0A7V1EJ14_UNCW3
MKLFFIFLIMLQITNAEQNLDAQKILLRVDDVLTAPKDLSALMKINIINKNGDTKNREVQMYQKANNKRLVKVISPADQKGIGFLSLPDDIMYVYLPAYKKTRRIAAHVKNQKFVGTDFTYEDLEAKNYSDKWNPEILKEEKDFYVLELTPKSGIVSEYSKMNLYVRKSDFFPIKAEYFNKKGEMIKIMEVTRTERIKDYIIPKNYLMQDLRSGNKTEMAMEEVKLDTGLGDDIFTERNLSK